MTSFPAYDLDKLLHTSYYRVVQLFSLANRSSDMKKFEIAIGNAALHDSKVGQALQQSEALATKPDNEAVQRLMTEQARNKADQDVQRYLQSRKGNNK